MVKRGPCGKGCYASRQKAFNALLWCIGEGRPQRRVYHCKTCEAYHLTSKP